ncbi:hypothetical protein [Rosistilla oblonga]|uniref:hypothetical protein n=1 Tax=Rosistilla oblonga TaxID=2527990 RepID=UPI003A9803B9
MHAKLLTVGLVLCLMHVPVLGQWNPQVPYRLAQTPGQPAPQDAPAVRVIQPATSGAELAPQPLPQPMHAPVPQPADSSVLDSSASQGAMSIDFDQVLSDEGAVGCGCATGANAQPCMQCNNGCGDDKCDNACCMAGFFGLDPCVVPPPVGTDPLGVYSLESVYKAEAHQRGLWATYPAEKTKQSLALRRSRVMPTPPQYPNGPMMYRPRVPACEPAPVEACPQTDECCVTPNTTQIQQAQLGRPGLPR